MGREFVKKSRVRKKRGVLIYFLMVVLLFIAIPALVVAQTFESAREKYEAGDVDGAEEELRAILKEDSENIEAQTLLNEIELMKRKADAEKMIDRALIDINNRNFESAYKYLEEAIVLDPENLRARNLYLSIFEISQIEGESMDEMIERESEELLALREEEEKVEEQPPEEVPTEDELVEEPIPPVGEVKEEMIAPEYDKALVKVSTAYTFANSDNLDFVDSKVSLLGARLDGRYYFDFLERRFGLSFDYAGNLLKISGDDTIQFTVHKLNASARFRTYFFESDHGRLTVGVRINYHLFLLQNREDLGVYNFTRLYGPSFGVFISDPVIYRFLKKKFFRNLGFEGDLNYLLLIGGGDDAPSSPEFYIGTYYNLKRYRFSLGYRRYSIRNSDIKESYNDIELGAGYRF